MQPSNKAIMTAVACIAAALSRTSTTLAFTATSKVSTRSFHGGMSGATKFTRGYSAAFRQLSSSSTTEEEQETIESTTLINKRIPIGSLSSLDNRVVIDNLDLVLSHLTSRRASSETLEAAKSIAARNEERVSLIQARDAALQTRNAQSAIVGQLMRKQKEDDFDMSLVDEAKVKSAAASEEASEADSKLASLEEEVSALLSGIPNLLDDIVPDGDDEEQNTEVEKWGDVNALPSKLEWEEKDYEPRWHDDVATSLGGWDTDRAVAMSGARFTVLSGPVAKLERAISSFFLDMHTNQHGYTEVSVPFVVGRSALEGTSQLPKFEEDLFKIDGVSHKCNGEDAFLIPTAEVPLTNMHREEILNEDDLPISYVALTPCFRAEAGSYGRDTRGLIRTHQFAKVELVKITSATDSADQHEQLTKHAQACLEALELPYRKVRLCSGDIGFSARHCYDMEVWLPGSGEYREISSCSNTGDFQAKRMGLRYRPNPPPVAATEEGEGAKKKGGKKKKAKKPKPVFCHTINGSGLAVGRTLLAVLENYQMPDGSVMVPEVLRPYLGGLEKLEKAK
jgi:seryl-tRNA synthetase